VNARKLWQQFSIIIAFAFVFIIFSLLSDVFLTWENIRNIPYQSAVIGVLATGMTLVILTGGIDLSVGSGVAFTGMIVALLHPYGTLPAILGGLLTGTFFGFLSGLLITTFDIPPFIVTLGMMTILRGATYIVSGGNSVPILSGNLPALGTTKPMIATFLLCVIVIAFILKATRFGRYLYAIGGSEEAARLSGVRVRWVKCGVYTIMGFLTGLAGLLLVARLSAADPTMGLMYELDAIASVVIGGTSLAGGYGGVGGTVIGVLLIGVLVNGLQLLNVPIQWQHVAKGFIIISAVLIDMLLHKRKT